jgi:hypothetical protein
LTTFWGSTLFHRLGARIFFSLALAAPSLVAPPGSAQADPPGNVRVSVRQGGGGEESGLLNGIEGPAALFALKPAAGAQFKNIAGVRAAPYGGPQQGYVAGAGRLAIADGTTLRVNYIGDEYSGEATGGVAGEIRLSTRIDDMTLGLSETVNRGFEGPWTGYGDAQALNATDAWASWSVLSNLSLGGGVRRLHRLDGEETTELSLNQSLAIGAGTISHSTVTGVGETAGTPSGSLSYYRPIFGSYGLDAGLDYASGAGLQATAAHLGTQGPIAGKWSLYASASQPLAEPAPAQFDGGVNGEIYGLTTNAYAGVATDGTGYVGVRLRMPLSPGPRRDRWLGF